MFDIMAMDFKGDAFGDFKADK